MSYVYDSVVISLGGKTLTNPTKEGSLVRGWSPNMFRRIAILTDGILVEYHGKEHRVRKLPFDLQKVTEDLSKGAKYKNPLRPLFEHKALSCLEEVVVSEMLVTEKMVKTYLASLVASQRLRAVGVSPSNLKVDDLENFINESNKSNHWFDFLISENVPSIKAHLTKIDDFQNRFLLRPSYYEMDSQNGFLRRYFESIKSAVDTKVEANKGKEDSIARYKKDLELKDFWISVVTFLKNKENQSNYPEFYSKLKNNSVITPDCNVQGLRELVGSMDSSMRSVYATLGYLQHDYSKELKGGLQGYLRSPVLLAKQVKPYMAQVVRSMGDSAKLLKIPKGSDEVTSLGIVLGVLNSETVGTSDKDVKTDFQKEDSNEHLVSLIRNNLSDELMSSLFEVWEGLSSDYKDTASILLTAKGRNYPDRFSEKELVSLGLSRHAETLSVLGYCSNSGSADLSLLSELSFSDSLNSLCRTVTKSSLSELMSSSWVSLSDVEKCNYIIRRL